MVIFIVILFVILCWLQCWFVFIVDSAYSYIRRKRLSATTGIVVVRQRMHVSVSGKSKIWSIFNFSLTFTNCSIVAAMFIYFYGKMTIHWKEIGKFHSIEQLCRIEWAGMFFPLEVACSRCCGVSFWRFLYPLQATWTLRCDRRYRGCRWWRGEVESEDVARLGTRNRNLNRSATEPVYELGYV